MNENIPDISHLKAYLNGDCSPEEERGVEKWLERSPEHVDKLAALAESESHRVVDFDQGKVKAQIMENINPDKTRTETSAGQQWDTRNLPPSSHTGMSRKVVQWFRRAAVWMIITTVGLATWLMVQPENTPEKIYSEVTSPVRTVTSYTLPDGSTVELNANSTLRYPSSFSADERIVYIEGEAFFEVVSDPKRPFRVRSGKLTTTVLGTKFNVNYMSALGKVEVALVEGSVEVGIHQQNDPDTLITLKPDQWIRYSDHQNILSVRQGVESKILWRDGILEFEENTLSEVAVMLENWYGVKIQIQDVAITEKKVIGSFKDASLEHVLEALKFIADIDYSIEKEKESIDRVILKKQYE